MKKILAICLSIFILANCTTTVFATEDPCSGSGEAEVTAHIYSGYLIAIPATINANTGTDEVTISQAALEDGYKVDVYVTNANSNGGITLTHTNGVNEILCVFENTTLGTTVSDTVPLVTFYATELMDTSTATKSFGMELMELGIPGHYSGTMTYSFSCTPSE